MITIILLAIGYIAMIYLAVFILSLLFPYVKGDDHGWLGVGAVLWPLSLGFFCILAIAVLVFMGPGQLARHLHNTAEEIIRKRRERRRDE